MAVRSVARPVERHDEWDVAVVIPARNESGTIEVCLRSVLRAADVAYPARAFVVVVADRCTDDTADISRRVLRQRGRVYEVEASSVGMARRLGTERAIRHVERWGATGGPRRVWIASTDADTEVPPHWITRQLDLARSGVGAVAGIVRLNDAPLDLRLLFETSYGRSVGATHGHVHAANMGVRADDYELVGGWQDVASGEDHCLWGRLNDAGVPTRNDSSLVVSTSARLEGRAPHGFARDLVELVSLLSNESTPGANPISSETARKST
jgi:hypothetical protein